MNRLHIYYAHLFAILCIAGCRRTRDTNTAWDESRFWQREVTAMSAGFPCVSPEGASDIVILILHYPAGEAPATRELMQIAVAGADTFAVLMQKRYEYRVNSESGLGEPHVASISCDTLADASVVKGMLKDLLSLGIDTASCPENPQKMGCFDCGIFAVCYKDENNENYFGWFDMESLNLGRIHNKIRSLVRENF